MMERKRPHLAIDARMAGDSGIGTYIRNLVPRIARARPDWRVSLLGRVDAMRELGWDELENATLVECRSRIYTIAEQVELARRMPAGVDAFWSPHYNIPLFHRARLVVTVHDVFHLAMPQFAPRLAQRAYARLMFDAVGRRADAILCDSEFTRRELRRFVPGVRVEPVVTHLGVDPVWREATGSARRGRPYVLFVGNVKPHKNLVRLVQAFGRIRDDVPHDLLVVGRREGFRTADADVARMADGLDGRVAFTGEVPFAELRALVAGADVLVAPSLYEGFGLPPLEAMAVGCPVLVANAASLPEVCGDAAVYCDPLDVTDIGEKLRAMLADGALRDTQRARGRAHVERFTWERCAGETLAVLDGVLA